MPDEHIRLVHASGKCEIDFARRELRVLGAAVPVGSRAFEVIEILARSAGEIVTKNELMGRIWPGAIVTENTLHVHTMAVRKALGPYRNLLKTESRRGFRLLGDWVVSRHEATRPPVGLQRIRVDDESPVTNIPAPVTLLIGRSAAVARLRDLVSAYRAVTLTGPGGIGKTSLALTVARGVVGQFGDGGWLVELASLSDPALVPTAVARALRLPTGPDSVTPEAIAHAIGDKKLLLVLDNCEHLVGAVATLAETLLARCPHIALIATSRETLRIQGEYVYRVLPLDTPAPGRDEADHILNHSAVELFIARAKALDTDFSLRVDELVSIGAICRHLDGIPLAIEFAAAHASTFGARQVAAGLHDRFALLTRGRRTALPRHRTLRGVLDWSYELLSKSEQRLLRHLPIFSGGFTVEAAAAVVNESVVGSSSVMEGIANLVAKSLVAMDRDMASRWYLLETIRAYALEKLAERGERDGAALRHATYFRDLFPRSGPGSSASISADERMGRIREIDNVRSALDWCFSTGGDTSVGVDLAAGCAVWLRVDVSTSLLDTGHGARQSLELLTKALGIAEALEDLYAQERALVGIITFHSFNAEHYKTRAAAERLTQVANRIGDAAVSRNADGLMGAALVMVGRPREAQGFLESYLNADRSMPEQQRLSGSGIERRAPARAFLSQALWLRGFINQARRENQASARAFLSRALWLRGFIDQARLEAQASLDELPATNLPFPLCRVLYYGVCRIMPTTGDFAAAELSIARLIEAATRINAPFWQTAGRFLSGKLMIEQGEFTHGVAVLSGAFDACRRAGWRISYPEFKGALATGLVGLGQLDEALAAVNEGLDDVAQAELGHDLFLAELLRIEGEILLRREAVSAAEDSLRAAINIARQQEALLWELRAALGLARLWVKQGRGVEARQLVAKVYNHFTEGFETPDLRAAAAFLDEFSG
jgi:predicted ATPase/DNA-binding winged helix-turn-helix (wHTH) protein